MPATKLGHAYWRTLQCGNPDAMDAESAYDRLNALPDCEEMTLEQTRPPQDYLIRHVIERSAEHGLPIQIHTGHHETSVSGDGNVILEHRQKFPERLCRFHLDVHHFTDRLQADFTSGRGNGADE